MIVGEDVQNCDHGRGVGQMKKCDCGGIVPKKENYQYGERGVLMNSNCGGRGQKRQACTPKFF